MSIAYGLLSSDVKAANGCWRIIFICIWTADGLWLIIFRCCYGLRFIVFGCYGRLPDYGLLSSDGVTANGVFCSDVMDGFRLMAYCPLMLQAAYGLRLIIFRCDERHMVICLLM